MFHTKRRWCVFDRSDLDEFSQELTSRRTWVLCNGIRWLGLLILNDATSEDSLAEYAVINEKSGAQVESLTVSWMKAPELRETLTKIAADKWEFVMVKTWTDQKDPRERIETLEQHGQRRCSLCA